VSTLDDQARALLAERFGPAVREYRPHVDTEADQAARRAAMLADLDRLPVDRISKARRLKAVS
jgi:hypothetical protein